MNKETIILLNTILKLSEFEAISVTLPIKYKDDLINAIEDIYGQVYCAPSANNSTKIVFGNLTIIFS